jgi:hypothetical protein
MATYGNTVIDGVFGGDYAFVNQGYGVTGFQSYAGYVKDPVASALVFYDVIGGVDGPIWIDTDFNKSTGFGGYEYHIIYDGTGAAPRLYSGSTGQTLVATLTDFVLNRPTSGASTIEFALPTSLIGNPQSVAITWGSTQVLQPRPASGQANGVVGGVTLDGVLSEWTSANRIDLASPAAGVAAYGKIADGHMIFALSIDNATTVAFAGFQRLWLKTDFNDHDAPEGFSGQNYLPDDMQPRRFYEPKERGAEARVKERVEHWRKLRAGKGE